MMRVPSIGRKWFKVRFETTDCIKSQAFQLYMQQNDGKVVENVDFAYLRSDWYPTTRLPRKDFRKQDLLCMQVSTFFELNNFGNT